MHIEGGSTRDLSSANAAFGSVRPDSQTAEQGITGNWLSAIELPAPAFSGRPDSVLRTV
jgi:hypothetical protein